MIKNWLFLSRRAARTTELFSLFLTEEQHPNCNQQQN
jgi:hypothetical protein